MLHIKTPNSKLKVLERFTKDLVKEETERFKEQEGMEDINEPGFLNIAGCR